MTLPAVLGGIGAAVNAISGIASSRRAAAEGKRAAQQMQQQQNFLNDVLMGGVDEETGERSGGLLGFGMEGMQEAIGNLPGLADQNAEALAGLANQAAGVNPNYNFSQHQFTDAPTVGGQTVGAAPNVGGYNFQGINTGQSYNFAPGQNLMDQTMDTFRTEAAGARANALDQMAAQSRADMAGLDAALAGRGLGRGSGVAAGALADLAGQQGQQRAGLERDLATLGSQTALQGAQFDVNRQLQQDQLGSQYNLGERGMLSDVALQQQGLQSQYGLGVDQLRSQNWGTREQLLAQLGMAEDQLRSQNWATDQQMRSNYNLGFQDMASQYGLNQAGFQLQNLMSQGDLLNQGFQGQLNTGLGVGGMYQNMMGPALNALLGSLGMQGDAVAAAGRGAGANPAGASIMDFSKMLPDLLGQGNISGADFLQQNAGYNPYNTQLSMGGSPSSFSVGNAYRGRF